MVTIAKIRQIGGSKGIVLKKSILELVDLGDSEEFEVEAKNGSIILTPHKTPLDEFSQFFKKNPDFSADGLLLDEEENNFDATEWTW